MTLFVYTCPCGKTVRHDNPIFRNKDGSESGEDLSKVKAKCARLCNKKIQTRQTKDGFPKYDR